MVIAVAVVGRTATPSRARRRVPGEAPIAAAIAISPRARRAVAREARVVSGKRVSMAKHYTLLGAQATPIVRRGVSLVARRKKSNVYLREKSYPAVYDAKTSERVSGGHANARGRPRDMRENKHNAKRRQFTEWLLCEVVVRQNGCDASRH